MNKFSITLLLFIFSANIIFAQSKQDTISYTKVFGGYKYTEGTRLLDFKSLSTILKQNKDAYKLYKSANGYGTVAQLLSGAGGAFIGWPIGQYISTGKAEWQLAAIGTACVAVAIPFAILAENKLNKSVNIYNSNINKNLSNSQSNTEIKLTFSGNALGLNITF